MVKGLGHRLQIVFYEFRETSNVLVTVKQQSLLTRILSVITAEKT